MSLRERFFNLESAVAIGFRMNEPLIVLISQREKEVL
jgi:hypothetical protein